MKPLLAVTLGDPSGIGPEVALKAAGDFRVARAARLVLIGEPGRLAPAFLKMTGAPLLRVSPLTGFRPGRADAESGRASFKAVRLAARWAVQGRVDGLVTAPSSKSAWAKAGLPYKGHADYFGRLAGVEPVMMFCAGRLRAALATDHVPFREVPGRLGGVARAAKLAAAALRSLGLRGRLGVCALNPHAGEDGLMGDEERSKLEPVLAGLRARGLAVRGPISGDGAWQRLAAGEFDALVALYHDQALGPLRLADPRRLVQWTLGLPFVRTSPGHGAAFDIAGRGRADPEAMIQAVLLAAKLSLARHTSGGRG